MTTSVSEPGIVPESYAGLEVSTVASDTLRAGLRVSGLLEASTVALLSCVVRTHLTAGRRYLRVDLTDADIADDAVVAALVDAHTRVAEFGGMLVFENAGPRVMAAVRSAALFVRAADA